MWVLLALGAALLSSFNPILYKRILEEAHPVSAVWAVTLLGLPLLGLFTLTLTPQMPSLDWVFLLAILGSVAFNAGAHLASTQALKLEEASLVTPLLTFSPAFTVLISAVFLDEVPTARGLTGVGLVLAGVYWLNYEPGKSWLTPFRSLTLRPGVILVLLAGLLWAITPLFEKMAILHTEPGSPRFVAFVGTTLLVLALTPPVLMRGRQPFDSLRRHRRELLLAGLIAGSAPILGYTAFSLGYVGYVTTLFKMSTILTVLWSRLLLKEQGFAQRLPASLLMVTGAILIVL